MKNLMIDTIKYIGILAWISLWLWLGVQEYKATTARAEEWERTKFRQELIIECQRLDSTKTNQKWGYKGCLRELELINKSEVRQL